MFANYYAETVGPDGEKRVGLKRKTRGGVIDDFAPGEEARLDALGSLLPKGGEMEPERLEAALARAISPTDVPADDFGHPPNVAAPGLGQEPRGDFLAGANLPRTDAPDVSDTAALSQFILEQKLNAADTVALADGDPEKATFVLEAEKAAHGQDPRATVEKPLQKLIDDEEAGR